jgi:Domain of unknown function (DUF4124)
LFLATGLKEFVMKMAGVLFFLLSMAFAGLADAEIYRWTDDRGIVHITDDYAKIPVKDRSRVTVDSDTANINVMPSEKPRKKVKNSPEKANKIRPAKRSPGENRRDANREDGQFSEHRKHQREDQPLVIPTTPARNAQNKIEEQQRKDRQLLENNQLPARRAQDQIEEQIRKTREGVSGH